MKHFFKELFCEHDCEKKWINGKLFHVCKKCGRKIEWARYETYTRI